MNIIAFVIKGSNREKWIFNTDGTIQNVGTGQYLRYNNDRMWGKLIVFIITTRKNRSKTSNNSMPMHKRGTTLTFGIF